MCGIIELLCTLCKCCPNVCSADRKLDSCCYCLPLRIGSICFGAFFTILDLLIMALFTIRYLNDPFEHRKALDHGIWDEIKRSMLPILKYEPAIILTLTISFAVWGSLDILLTVAAVLRWRTVLKVWVIITLVRFLHVFPDTLVIVLTCMYVKDCAKYLYPNFVSLVSLPLLLYARGVVCSYASELKRKSQIESEIERRLSGRRSSLQHMDESADTFDSDPKVFEKRSMDALRPKKTSSRSSKSEENVTPDKVDSKTTQVISYAAIHSKLSKLIDQVKMSPLESQSSESEEMGSSEEVINVAETNQSEVEIEKNPELPSEIRELPMLPSQSSPPKPANKAPQPKNTPQSKANITQRSSTDNRRGGRVPRNPVPHRNRQSLSQTSGNVIQRKPANVTRRTNAPLKAPTTRRSMP